MKSQKVQRLGKTEEKEYDQTYFEEKEKMNSFTLCVFISKKIEMNK